MIHQVIHVPIYGEDFVTRPHTIVQHIRVHNRDVCMKSVYCMMTVMTVFITSNPVNYDLICEFSVYYK